MDVILQIALIIPNVWISGEIRLQELLKRPLDGAFGMPRFGSVQSEFFRTVWQHQLRLGGYFGFHFMHKNVSDMTDHSDFGG